MIAHNASFDIRMINGELRRHGKSELKARVLCSRSLARRHVKGLFSYRLEAVARRLGISAERQEHRALADALLVAGVALDIYRMQAAG